MTPEQDALILNNLDLVRLRVIALGYIGAPYADELQDEARLALVRAADDYQNSKGKTFRAWAILRIDAAIRDYIRRNDTMTRDQRRHFNKMGELKKPRLFRSKLKRRCGHRRKHFLDPAAFRRGFLASGVRF